MRSGGLGGTRGIGYEARSMSGNRWWICSEEAALFCPGLRVNVCPGGANGAGSTRQL